MSPRGIPEYAFNLQLAREIKQALVDAGGEPRSETKTQGDGGLSRCWCRSARIAAIRAITDHMAAQIGETALDERGFRSALSSNPMMERPMCRFRREASGLFLRHPEISVCTRLRGGWETRTSNQTIISRQL